MLRNRVAAAALAVLLVSACDRVRPAPAPRPVERPAGRLPLDPEASPVEFRWLSEDVVFVDTKAGTKDLAGFGNFVRRETGKLPKVRLSVWDDETAWQRFAAAEEAEAQVVGHKRAEYLKEPGPDPVDRFVVFDPEGAVVYQRDFLAWPLTDLDE